MQKVRHEKDMLYSHQDNTITRFDLEIYKGEPTPEVREYHAKSHQKNEPLQDPYTFVLSNVEGNQQQRDQVVHDVAHNIQEAYGLSPESISLFEQKQDGNYDKVEFRHYGNGWGECGRTPYTPEQFQKLIGEEHTLEPPRDRGAEQEARQREEIQTTAMPETRSELREEERQEAEATVDESERVRAEQRDGQQQNEPLFEEMQQTDLPDGRGDLQQEELERYEQTVENAQETEQQTGAGTAETQEREQESSQQHAATQTLEQEQTQ